jgi:hypothetical protein
MIPFKIISGNTSYIKLNRSGKLQSVKQMEPKLAISPIQYKEF